MVFPKPLAPINTKLRASARKSSVKARSIKGRSIFWGQCQSKSQGFEATEARLSQTAFEAAAGAILAFGAGDLLQQLARRPALSRGASQQVVQGVSGKDEAEMFQLGGQIIARVRVFRCLGRVHRKPPERDLRRSGFQIGAAREVDGQQAPALALAVTGGEDKSHRGSARAATVESLAQGGGEFGGTVIIEQAEELNGETGRGFTALESGLKEGLAFRHQGGQAAGGGGAEGLALLFEQSLAVRRIFEELMTIIGAAVRG